MLRSEPRLPGIATIALLIVFDANFGKQQDGRIATLPGQHAAGSTENPLAGRDGRRGRHDVMPKRLVGILCEGSATGFQATQFSCRSRRRTSCSKYLSLGCEKVPATAPSALPRPAR